MNKASEKKKEKERERQLRFESGDEVNVGHCYSTHTVTIMSRMGKTVENIVKNQFLIEILVDFKVFNHYFEKRKYVEIEIDVAVSNERRKRAR